MNDKGVIGDCLTSSLFSLLKPENKSQIKLLKDSNSTKMKELLMNGSITFTLYSNKLTLRDSKNYFYIRWRSFENDDKLYFQCIFHKIKN